MTPAQVSLTKYRRKLPHAWQPFFGRFGSLTEVQLRTIPEVMRGRNVVVSAPTATGKTEAVVAPVAERHVQETWPGLAVVYVTPTRALGNDLDFRLVGPLEEMSLTTVLKHGERSRLPAREIHWLITTPESLDSLICRRSELVQNLRVAIVDEIHLLDGTYRGDQVRILLERLSRLTDAKPLAVHLLSATLANPEDVARRYIDDFELVLVEGARAIRPHLLQNHSEIRDLAISQGWRKLLYFCNTRQCVEETASTLRELWDPYPVVAHHGSLDRREREETEEVMKHSRVAICVATSTLEIGIDIGDIDLVVLAEPPWSLEALHQRVGRGSRRADIIQAAALCRSEDEHEMLARMFEAAGKGYGRPDDYRPDLSVVVQQIFSLLYQYRAGVHRSELIDLVSQLAPPQDVSIILGYLMDKGYCLQIADSLYPSSELLDFGDEGKIHSNIPDQSEYIVVNVDSGQPVGRIRGAFDQVFLLSGQSWKVILVEGNHVMVSRYPRGAPAATFGIQRNVGQFHYLLPPEMRNSS